MLLRPGAAVPAEHALLSGEGLQQVQGGTGESEDAFTAALSFRRDGGVWRRLDAWVRLGCRVTALGII